MRCKWCEVERDVPAAGPHVCDPSNVRAVAFRDAETDIVIYLTYLNTAHASSAARRELDALLRLAPSTIAAVAKAIKNGAHKGGSSVGR